MLQRLTIALLLAVSTTALAATGEFRRELTLGSGSDVYVSTGSGFIHVSPASGNHVIVVGHVHTNGWSMMSSGDAEERVRKLVANPPIQQSGNVLRVGESQDRGLMNNISIDYEVQVPRDAALNLHSGSGDTQVRGVGRYLSASSGSGNISAEGVAGPAELQAGSGDISLTEHGSGSVSARAGSGSIQLQGLDGPVTARTGSGDILVAGKVQGPGQLQTGSGSVRMKLSTGSRMNVSASTGSGSIRAEVPGLSDRDSDRRHLTGAVNGGGAPLEIRTGSGDIEIESQ